MTEQHTPGPWQAINIEPYAKKANRRWLVNPDVAVCYEEADAQLIAAAPDLLGACKATVAAYSTHQLYDKCPFDMLRAAIAKAIGEGPNGCDAGTDET